MKSKFNMLNPKGIRMTAAFFLCAVVIALGSLAPNAVAQDDAQPIAIVGKTMGPIDYRVVVASPASDLDHDELAQSITSALDRVNQLMSTYQPDSDVSRFNNDESTDWVEVDPETVAVVARSLEISRATEGKFDITVGPLVALWKFGAAANRESPVVSADQLPTQSEIDTAMKLVGFDKLEVRDSPPAIRKKVSGLKIDLSAIAKGFAVDQVAKSLEHLGCENYMVIVGGDGFARGYADVGTKRKWRLGIEKPNELFRDVDSAAELSSRGLATSGDYRNFYLVDGKRFSHAIDPATGRPTESRIASASVLASDGMTADALATALMVADHKQASAFCKPFGAEYLLATRTLDSATALSGAPQLEYHQSTDFPSVALTSVDDQDKDETESIWPTFVGALIIFTLAILGMAVGTIFNNKPIAGSCGGLSAMGGESECGVCNEPAEDCVETTAEV